MPEVDGDAAMRGGGADAVQELVMPGEESVWRQCERAVGRVDVPAAQDPLFGRPAEGISLQHLIQGTDSSSQLYVGCTSYSRRVVVCIM